MKSTKITVFDISNKISSTFKRARIKDSGDYIIRLSKVIAICLEEGCEKELLYKKMARVNRSDLIKYENLSLDDILQELANSFHGCALESYDQFTGAIFPPRSEFTAFYQVIGIIETAGKTLDVIDQYADRLTLLSIDRVRPHVITRFLTRPPQKKKDVPLFESLCKKLMSDRLEIEIRYVTPGVIHDRFLVVDTVSWALGHSINAIGNKLSSITKKSGRETTQLKQIFSTLWLNSISI
jgi:hypothetical protein